jgi:hypothetical protein
VCDQSVKQGAERGLLLGVQAAKDVLVALGNQLHGALEQLAPGGREAQHHTTAVVGPVFLAHQALLHQRLCGAAGLAFVQVGLRGQVLDRQRLKLTYGGQAAPIAEGEPGVLWVSPLTGRIGQLVQQVQAVSERAV